MTKSDSNNMSGIENIFQSILGDVNPYSEDDHARRGLIYVRNFMRALLQMNSIREARQSTNNIQRFPEHKNMFFMGKGKMPYAVFFIKQEPLNIKRIDCIKKPILRNFKISTDILKFPTDLMYKNVQKRFIEKKLKINRKKDVIKSMKKLHKLRTDKNIDEELLNFYEKIIIDQYKRKKKKEK